jgi:hypothetical protein
MDVLYPPGTKFYFKQDDGTYVDAGIEIGPDAVDPTQPEIITEEFMIAKATEFMELRGYTIFVPGTAPSESEQVNDLKSQVSALKDELAAYRKPTSEVSMAKIETGVLFAKLRNMVASHFPSRPVIEEAHAIIAKIEEKL